MRSSEAVLRARSLRSPAPADRRDAAALPLGALLDGVRAGDDDAFREVHRRFVRVVHGIALGRVPRSDAEDVVQEVFARVHRNLAALRDAEAFPAWICTTARNVAADSARRQRRAPPTEPLRDVPAPARPDGARDDDGLRERVLVRLAELPEAFRETLLLRLAEGLTGPEIAERTGRTPGSVRVNLCRGMARLRELLREEDLR